MDAGAAPQAARRTRTWCATCGQAAYLKTAGIPPELHEPVPAKTGKNWGPGYGVHGHAAVLTDENPILRATASQIEAGYREFDVSAADGLTARWKPGLAPPGMEQAEYRAADGHALRDQLDQALRSRAAAS